MANKSRIIRLGQISYVLSLNLAYWTLQLTQTLQSAIISNEVFRYRKNHRVHNKQQVTHICALCDLKNSVVVEDNEHVTIVKNKYPYDIWEHRKVVDHLLIVPKIHAKSLVELPNEFKYSMLSLITKYETWGYDVYARSVNSNLRSVADHQHTHLIKTAGECAKVSLYIKKPYLVAKV